MLLIGLAAIGMLSRHFGSFGQVLAKSSGNWHCQFGKVPQSCTPESVVIPIVGHILQKNTELLSADLTACCTAALRRTRCLLQMQLLLTSTLTLCSDAKPMAGASRFQQLQHVTPRQTIAKTASFVQPT